MQEFTGYTTNAWAFAAYLLLTVLTGGLLWVIGHYFPQIVTCTMSKSSLGEAQYVQAKVTAGFHVVAGRTCDYKFLCCILDGLECSCVSLYIFGCSDICTESAECGHPMHSNVIMIATVVIIMWLDVQVHTPTRVVK